MAKRKSKGSKQVQHSGHSSGTPRVHWTNEIWKKVAERFAAIEIRHQQGGASASFHNMMTEAQAFLPKNYHRPHLNGYAQANHGFDKLVKKAKEALLMQMKAEHKGKVNGVTMEVLVTANDKIAYEIPPAIILNQNLRSALRKAGCQFMVIDGLGGIHDILGGRVERIERLATS